MSNLWLGICKKAFVYVAKKGAMVQRRDHLAPLLMIVPFLNDLLYLKKSRNVIPNVTYMSSSFYPTLIVFFMI